MSILDQLGDFLQEYALPITAGGQLASVALQSQAEKKYRQQKQALIDAEQARQADITARARAAFQQVVPQFTPQAMDARRKAEETRLQGALAPAAIPSTVVGNYQNVVNENQPQAVGGDLTNKVGAALSEAKANANRLALARSFGATGQKDALTLAGAGREVSRAGRDAQASAGILPLELDTAGLEAARRRAPAEMLGVATGIAGLYGASRPKKQPPVDKGLLRDTGYYGGPYGGNP